MAFEPKLKVEATEYGNHYITTEDGTKYNLREGKGNGLIITADGPLVLEPQSSNMLHVSAKDLR